MNNVLIRYDRLDCFERQKELVDEDFVDEYIDILKQCDLVANICVFPITVCKLHEE